jgi:hypothetical protein
VPTVAELGYKDFETVQWYGITARAGTPPEILLKLQQECAKARSRLMSSPSTQPKAPLQAAAPPANTVPSLPENNRAGKKWCSKQTSNRVDPASRSSKNKNPPWQHGGFFYERLTA